MRSNNPVFNRSPEFNGQSNPYSDPSTWSTGEPTQGAPGGYPDLADQGRMTVDSVVQRTGVALLVVIGFAAATWLLIGDLIVAGNVVNEANWGRLTMALLAGSGLAFVLSLVNSFKRVISPGLVLAFAAAEGVALGALSKYFDVRFGDGIVTQAVIGTFAAFAGTLAAYKFFNITVTDRFRKFVVAAMFGMVALSLLELGLSFFGNAIGFYGFTTLGLVFAVVGLVLGIFMLLLDFDFVERGVAAGLPERESWRAAFAITVSLVWIYTNLLRILAIMRGGD